MREISPYRIGDKIRFTPAAWLDERSASSDRWGKIDTSVLGIVVGINRRHRYARVAYKTADGTTAYECFKF